MRKALGLVSLGCCLAFALACSPGTTTPTQPAATSSANAQSVGLETAVDKIYICHGNLSDPYGVVVEVTGQTLKRHNKHISSNRDCICEDTPIAGDVCDPYSPNGDYCYYTCSPAV